MCGRVKQLDFVVATHRMSASQNKQENVCVCTTYLDGLPLPIKQELQCNEALNVILVNFDSLCKRCRLPPPDGVWPEPPSHVLCVFLHMHTAGWCNH